ncbi:helix-turn-helix transcriptional regulator [Aureimonas sp. ME7]|uniref:helix-turn-helix domain-containing protein n=1 Tax=Aureimonas sp. ME7 TaxID=2744252 RepID=UPI0015F66280|nr:helix-turn-helix transcriptional regulator [Aureimonas sp. ME7]
MPLSDNITRLRVTDGKTIEDVAEGARLPVALVAGLESGRSSGSPKSLKALAGYFGVSVDALLR